MIDEHFPSFQCYSEVHLHIKHLIPLHCFPSLSRESRKEISDLLRVRDYYSDFK